LHCLLANAADVDWPRAAEVLGELALEPQRYLSRDQGTGKTV